jgi:hypothetical protein
VVVEKEEKELVFFFISLAGVPIQLGCKQVKFPVCCTIQFDEVVVEKEEKELVFFLLVLPAYRYNSSANKNNFPCAGQFISDIDSLRNVLSETADNRTNDEIGNNRFHSSRY